MVESYVEAGYWTDATTLDWLDRHARERPDKVALVDSRIRLTWRATQAAVDQLAEQFATLKLARDTPVVVQLPNCAETCLIQLALKKIGLLGAYVPVVWRQRELASLMDQLHPGAIVVPPAFRDFDLLEMARDLRQLHPDLRVAIAGETLASMPDCLQLVLEASGGAPQPGPTKDERSLGPFEVTKLAVTSGSTGAAKIVEMTEQQQLLWGKGTRERLALTADDHIGGFVPLAGGPRTRNLGHMDDHRRQAGAVRWLCTRSDPAVDRARTVASLDDCAGNSHPLARLAGA